MAIQITQNLTNITNKYVADGKEIRGTYIVVADNAERAKINKSVLVGGTVVYGIQDKKT